MHYKDPQKSFDVATLAFDEHGELVGLAEDELLAVVGGTVSDEATNSSGSPEPNTPC